MHSAQSLYAWQMFCLTTISTWDNSLLSTFWTLNNPMSLHFALSSMPYHCNACKFQSLCSFHTYYRSATLKFNQDNVLSKMKTSKVTLLQVQESLQHNQAVQQQQLNQAVQQQQHNQAVQQQQHNQAVQQQQQQSILQCLPNRLEQQLNVPSADMQVRLYYLLCR